MNVKFSNLTGLRRPNVGERLDWSIFRYQPDIPNVSPSQNLEQNNAERMRSIQKPELQIERLIRTYKKQALSII